MQSILIVEDDNILATSLSAHLRKQGYQTSTETSGDRALPRILSERPDAVILDGSLPGKDGFDVCREARRAYRGVILMLTARDEDMDRIMGLELGADDFLVKPTEPRVVAAHLKACLRRSAAWPDGDPEELRFGSLRISRTERTVHLSGQEVDLSSAEFDLLWQLARSAGTVRTRDEIMNDVRHIPHDGLDRSIDMRVSRLRKRLGDDPDNPRRIKTVRGKGYLFSRTDWE